MYAVACVAVENATYAYDREYSYRIPDALRESARVGCRVRVPFGGGNRKRTALILRREEVPDPEGLKPLLAVLDAEPWLDEEALWLLRYLRAHTFCTWFDAVRALLPAGLGLMQTIVYTAGPSEGDAPAGLTGLQRDIASHIRNSRGSVPEDALCAAFGISPGDSDLDALVQLGAIKKSELLTRKVPDAKTCMVRLTPEADGIPLSKRQKDAVAFLRENGDASLREICYYTAMTRGVVDKLRDKGAVEYYDEIRLRDPYADSEEAISEAPVVLSKQQAAALEALKEGLAQEHPKPALLYGVTGSGKTQVFLALIDHVLAAGRSVIVMVPEISLTAQTVRAFQDRFGKRVAVLHSGLSLGERMDAWRRVKNGDADIVVGTRSAVFAPLKNIGLIVMDEEQEHTYHSEKSPRYHARDVARARCGRHGALLLLSSATPSVESYYYAQTGRYGFVSLEERFGAAVLPDVCVVDMREADNRGASALFSQRLLEEIRYNLTHGEQSILLLNRRGYATLVRCSSCGAVAECPHCTVSMTYHRANNSLICHFCGYTSGMYTQCRECQSEMVRYSGTGTQKAEEELAALFPDARILRMDTDTTSTKFSHDRLFYAFSRNEYDIMIGTQMVAKGLNFPNVTLAAVLQADQSLYAPDFRSFERSFSLLTQVIGRSGRADKPGRAFIQTWSPESPVIRLASQQDYPAFYRQEIRSRKLHLYPPFCTMASIGFSGLAEQEVRRQAARFLDTFRERAASRPELPIRVLGPVAAETLRAAGKYRYRMIVKCKNNRDMRALLQEVLEWFASESKTVSAYIDLYYDRN